MHGTYTKIKLVMILKNYYLSSKIEIAGKSVLVLGTVSEHTELSAKIRNYKTLGIFKEKSRENLLCTVVGYILVYNFYISYV